MTTTDTNEQPSDKAPFPKEETLTGRGYVKVECACCLGRDKLFPGCSFPVTCLKCGGSGYRWKDKRGSYNQ